MTACGAVAQVIAAAFLLSACSSPSQTGAPTAAATAGPAPTSPTRIDPTVQTQATVASSVPTPTVTVLGRQTEDPTAVVVYAASLLGGVFTDLAGPFMLSTSEATGVSYKFDDSALLGSMIQQGADADVFASADPAQIASLRQANLLDGADAVLAHDRLVIVLDRANTQAIQSLKDLARAGTRYIIPSPKSPTTAAIEVALDKASADPAFGSDFRARAERNVLARDGDDSFVVERIVAGEVNAGVVYASHVDLHSRTSLQVIDIPDSVNSVIDYPIAVLKKGTNPRGGRAFMNYVLSTPAQDVLARWGFTPRGAS